MNVLLKKGDSSRNIVRNSIRKRSTKNSWYDLFEEVTQQIDESPDIPSSVWNDFEKLASISVSLSSVSAGTKFFGVIDDPLYEI